MSLMLGEGSAANAARQRVSEAIADFSLADRMTAGVAVGLSGGADSLFLLCCLRDLGYSPLALHVHHHLRGEEADRDAAFCEAFCREQEFPFFRRDVAVREEAARCGTGIEETARRLRYQAFSEFIAEQGIEALATAHNATDNAETVLLHILRGGGARALCGIPPIRDRFVRPLLYCTKQEITAALQEAGLAYVTDSSNADTTLARNYLRAEILPRLQPLSPTPERAFLRLCANLRGDADYLDALAAERYLSLVEGDAIAGERLLLEPTPLRYRILRRLYEDKRGAEASSIALEQTHIHAILRLIEQKPQGFSYAVPHRLFAVYEAGRLRFDEALPKEEAAPTDALLSLTEGEHRWPGGFTLSLFREADGVTVRCFSNLHKIDTKIAISFDRIKGTLSVRARRPGDAYRLRGHTHPLKKLFNEKKIPPHLRKTLPILCDEAGILWIPLLGLREERKECHE